MSTSQIQSQRALTIRERVKPGYFECKGRRVHVPQTAGCGRHLSTLYWPAAALHVQDRLVSRSLARHRIFIERTFARRAIDNNVGETRAANSSTAIDTGATVIHRAPGHPAAISTVRASFTIETRPEIFSSIFRTRISAARAGGAAEWALASGSL